MSEVEAEGVLIALQHPAGLSSMGACVRPLWKWHELVMTAGFKFHLSILQDSEVPVESDNG